MPFSNYVLEKPGLGGTHYCVKDLVFPSWHNTTYVNTTIWPFFEEDRNKSLTRLKSWKFSSKALKWWSSCLLSQQDRQVAKQWQYLLTFCYTYNKSFLITTLLLLFSGQVVSNSSWPHELNMSGFAIPHHVPEFAQVYVHWIGDAIQSSHPVLPSFPAFNLSQHQSLF